MNTYLLTNKNDVIEKLDADNNTSNATSARGNLTFFGGIKGFYN